MPIKIPNDLPVNAILDKENIFVMDEDRAIHQDIRPIRLGILNLMPLKEDTELHLLRMLSNTPLQVDVSFLSVSTHESKNTSKSHLNRFYQHFSEIEDSYLDGLIVTGAPVEQMEYEDVDYWGEFTRILDWASTHVTSTLFLCWGAQAALYYYYGIKKYTLDKKVFGVYSHEVRHRKVPLVRGFDDQFMAPHSRYTNIDSDALKNIEDIVILAESAEVGVFLCMSNDGKRIFCMGHPEYDRMTLDKEYHRDLDKGLNTAIPKNYYPGDDPSQKPLLQWRGHANTLYTNWVNYYVYQATPYEFNKKVDVETIGALTDPMAYI